MGPVRLRVRSKMARAGQANEVPLLLQNTPRKYAWYGAASSRDEDRSQSRGVPSMLSSRCEGVRYSCAGGSHLRQALLGSTFQLREPTRSREDVSFLDAVLLDVSRRRPAIEQFFADYDVCRPAGNAAADTAQFIAPRMASSLHAGQDWLRVAFRACECLVHIWTSARMEG
ncbi:hypothetical protein BD309DRAFT_303858 [Dichomitus squalens]|nr:hypothetical protein BD309DRAFT_303858 [Dichomitus squalens]